MADLNPYKVRINFWVPPPWDSYNLTYHQWASTRAQGNPGNPAQSTTGLATTAARRYRYSGRHGLDYQMWANWNKWKTTDYGGFKGSMPTDQMMSFEMVLRTNEVSVWRASFRYDPYNPTPDMKRMLELLDTQGLIAQVWLYDERTAKNNNAFATQTPAQQQDRSYYPDYVFASHTNITWNDNAGTSNTQRVGRDNIAGKSWGYYDFYRWARTGMLGPLTLAQIDHDQQGAVLNLEGACSLKWLDDTLHFDYPVLNTEGEYPDPTDYFQFPTPYSPYALNLTTGNNGNAFQTISHLLSRNAELPMKTTASVASSEPGGIPSFSFGDGWTRAALATYAPPNESSVVYTPSEIIPTQIGRMRIRAMMSPITNRVLRGSASGEHSGLSFEPVDFTPGAHSVLDTMKLIWEHYGLICVGHNPLLYHRVAEHATNPLRQTWSHQHIRSARVGYLRPEATLWNVRNRFRTEGGDVRRLDVRVGNNSASGEGNIENWGAIMTQEVAVSEEKRVSGAYPTTAQVSQIQASSAAQIRRDGVRQAQELELAVELSHEVAGARWGVDWNIGDRITLDLFPHTTDAVGRVSEVVVREVAVSVGAGGEVSISAGFTPHTDLLPSFPRYDYQPTPIPGSVLSAAKVFQGGAPY